MSLGTSFEVIGTVPVLSLDGDVDLATVPRLHQAVTQLIERHPGATIAIDLDAVDSLQDAGLGILLGAAARTRDLGGELVLVCASERVRARLASTRLDRAVPVHPSVAAVALAS